MRYPIDASALTFLVGSEPRALKKYGSEEPRTTAEGEPIYSLDIAAMNGETMERIVVKVPGRPDVQPCSQVKIVGLTVQPWEANGRTGVSFTADRIEPATKFAKAG